MFCGEGLAVLVFLFGIQMRLLDTDPKSLKYHWILDGKTAKEKNIFSGFGVSL